MDNPEEIIRLSQERLDEATILCSNSKWNGAFYLAGYSVEFALKAKICALYGVPNLFKLEDPDQNRQNRRAPTARHQDMSVELKAKEEAIDTLKKQVKTHNLFTLLFYSCLREKFDEEKAINPDFSILASLVLNGWTSEARYKPCGHFNNTDVQNLITLLPGLLLWIRNN